MVDLVGLAAGLFVILAFYARSLIWMRKFALASNCLFLFYAVQMKLWPIFILHGVLLPLNFTRLLELRAWESPRLNQQMTDFEREQFLTYLKVAKNTHAWSCG